MKRERVIGDHRLNVVCSVRTFDDKETLTEEKTEREMEQNK